MVWPFSNKGEPLTKAEAIDAVVSSIEVECANHSKNAIIWEGKLIIPSIMKQCLEDGGVENYKERLLERHNNHGLPPVANTLPKDDRSTKR